MGGELAVHIFWLLLVIAVLLRSMTRLRLTVGAAALAALLHALLIAGDLVTAAWSLLLLLAASLLVAHRFYQNKRVRFTEEEEGLRAQLLASLPPSRARPFLDQGFWLSGNAGDALTREGEPVRHLYYLAAGEARVMSRGVQVGTCRAGDLIGELTALAEEPASVTVLLQGPARFWCAPSALLRPYLAMNDDVQRALEHGFASSLRTKLRQTSRAIAEAGGMSG